VFSVYADTQIYIGQSTSLTMRYDQEPVSHSCQTVPELPRNQLVGEGSEDE